MTGSTATRAGLAPATAVKVCGLRKRSDAQACAAAGVSYAGLNRVAASRRCVGLQECVAIVDELRSCAATGQASVEPVLVYRDSTRAQILSESNQLGVRWVQLHGGESVEMALLLQASGLQVIRALPGTTPVQTLQAWLESADILLLDGTEAGSGQPWAWTAPKDFSLQRIWIAGGLSPHNVAAALSSVNAAGVDAASGLETDGALDPLKIEEFVQQVSALERAGRE